MCMMITFVHMKLWRSTASNINTEERQKSVKVVWREGAV